MVTQGTHSQTTVETAAAKGAASQVSLFSMFMFTEQTLVFTKRFVKRRFLGGCILNFRNILGCILNFRKVSNKTHKYQFIVEVLDLY